MRFNRCAILTEGGRSAVGETADKSACNTTFTRASSQLNTFAKEYIRKCGA